MGYRSEEQALEAPLSKLLEGAEEYRRAAVARMNAGGWTSAHMIELQDLIEMLEPVVFKARLLRKSTW